ncbi:hypothetical protein ACWCQN_39380 [Streptomyces sp. NPDC001984]
MERYDTPSTADPFDRSMRLFTTLVADLTGPASAGLHHDELEELLDLRGRDVRCFEDCTQAEPVTQRAGAIAGVAPYALDRENAARL